MFKTRVYIQVAVKVMDKVTASQQEKLGGRGEYEIGG